MPGILTSDHRTDHEGQTLPIRDGSSRKPIRFSQSDAPGFPGLIRGEGFLLIDHRHDVAILGMDELPSVTNLVRDPPLVDLVVPAWLHTVDRAFVVFDVEVVTARRDAVDRRALLEEGAVRDEA